MVRRLAPFALLPVLAFGLTACGTGSVSADDVAKSAEDALEQQVGTRPDVTCPDDLEAKVGAKTRCTLSVKGDDHTYGVTVTVSSVEGDKAHFDVKVDDQPQG